MADETKIEKKSVAGVVLSAQEIAYHAEALYKREWDADRNALRNPNAVILGLLAYVRLTATRLHEAESRIATQQTAADKRIAELETRLTTMERWKSEAEAMTSEMSKAAEAMIEGGPEKFIEKLRSSLPPALAVVKELVPAEIIDEVPPMPAKPELVEAETQPVKKLAKKIEAKAEVSGEKKGDVA